MLSHGVSFLVVIGVVYFGVNYNKWLKRSRGCSAFTFWRVLGGVADLFVWIFALNTESTNHNIILFCIALTVFFLLFYVNYKDSQSILHGFLMTLWLLLIGGVIIWILGALMRQDEKH